MTVLVPAGSERRQEFEALLRTYRTFQLTYEDDPLAFVHDCFDWSAGGKPTGYQDEILGELPVRRKVAVRSPHGVGKTAIAAWAILWFSLTRDGDDWKIPTTASVWRQLAKFLWPEVHKWARRIRWNRIGREPLDERLELQQLNLKLRTGEAFSAASNVPGTLEGAHADHLMHIFDESKLIPDETFDVAEGASLASGSDTVAEAYALAISTPGEPHGRFYEIHQRRTGLRDWWVRHITVEEGIKAGRISREKVTQLAQLWGEQSATFQNRVLGEFAEDQDAIIPLAWVEAANERWREWVEAGRPMKGLRAVGVDVSGGGAAKTKFAPRCGDVITEIRNFIPAEGLETTSTSGAVKGLIKMFGGVAVVDVIGIGAGVVHQLREKKVNVVPFHAAERSRHTDRSGELGFINMRAAAWWGMRERLDPAFGSTIALPPDDDLTGDLTAPHRRPLTSAGKIQIEDKDAIQKRLGRSTDAGDAVVQSFALELLTRHKPSTRISSLAVERVSPHNL